MKFVLYSLVVIVISLSVTSGRRCSHLEFECFWDGSCISRKLVCNGKHDCPKGEDEINEFAKCGYCPGEFHCIKNPDEIECINIDYACDDLSDCLFQEDEDPKIAGCETECGIRNETAAALTGRPSCRKACTSNAQCKPPDKLCLCDYECGKSCVNIKKRCPRLPMFPNLETIRYVGRDKSTNEYIEAREPFLYDVEAHHICKPGFVAMPNNVRLCHGRGLDWTNPVYCAISCQKKNPKLISRDKLTCGLDCITDADCAAGKSCTCDGACGRTCVNLEIECPDVPSVENADIEYTGEKFERVAHYLCKVGTYPASGDLSRKCSGSGKWDGVPVVCKRVTCGNPTYSISAMSGHIVTNLSPPYYYNTTLRFACEKNQRLVGFEERTCMANGRWSGVLTVCDRIVSGEVQRCTHPGVPINGYIVGYPGDDGFNIGEEVTFRCNDGFAMVGDATQKCLFFKQWSGLGAPLCVDPRYSDIPSDVINKLSQSTSRIRDTPKYLGAGRSVQINEPGGIEIYFLIDLSLSVSRAHLKNTVGFAKGLVRRLKKTVKDKEKVKYGIIVFATKAKVYLDILRVPRAYPDEVLQILDRVELEIAKIREEIKVGTDIQGALRKLDQEQISDSWELDKKLIVKRHIFVLSDGKKNAGGSPGEARAAIEFAYADNKPEDYEAREQLREIASNYENFIYVEDFYKLSKYIDEITDAREDYSKCGQSENIGDLRKLAYAGRVAGGQSAKNKAWPWQVLIHLFDNDIVTSFSNEMILGGGSLINSKWVLSAAHVFWMVDDGSDFWHENLVLSLGITRRPTSYNDLEGSVEMYQPEKVYIHEDFVNFIYTNDIALIKIGGIYTTDRKNIKVPTAWPGNVTFTPYIRPVCLPCSPDSCVSKVLMSPDQRGNILLTGDEEPDERCNIESDFIMEAKNEKAEIGAFVTGFGHNETWKDGDDFQQIITKDLQQGLLKIEKPEECEDGVQKINREKVDGNHVFDDKMLCARSAGAVRGKITDACKGDSGGPLVREVVHEDTKTSCFVEIGIVSWGHGCADLTEKDFEEYTYPGYYVKVTAFIPWIQNTMNNHKSDEERR